MANGFAMSKTADGEWWAERAPVSRTATIANDAATARRLTTTSHGATTLAGPAASSWPPERPACYHRSSQECLQTKGSLKASFLRRARSLLAELSEHSSAIDAALFIDRHDRGVARDGDLHFVALEYVRAFLGHAQRG